MTEKKRKTRPRIRNGPSHSRMEPCSCIRKTPSRTKEDLKCPSRVAVNSRLPRKTVRRPLPDRGQSRHRRWRNSCDTGRTEHPRPKGHPRLQHLFMCGSAECQQSYRRWTLGRDRICKEMPGGGADPAAERLPGRRKWTPSQHNMMGKERADSLAKEGQTDKPFPRTRTTLK